MSTVVTPPSVVYPRFIPRPLRWTATEFHRVNSTGIWEGRRPYLLNGVIVEQGPMNPPHAVAVTLVDAELRRVFAQGYVVRVQLPLTVDEASDPFPDFAIVPGHPRDFTDHPKAAVLVVEVSDTSLTADLTDKAEKYAAAGVADYWVLDIEGRRLLVFRDPQPVAANGNSYRSHLTLGPNDTVSPLAAPGATVRVADLLP